jgi:hypothetical protein
MLRIECVDQAADLVQILARTRANQATCPSCGVPSGRTHSRYRRRLAAVRAEGLPGLTASADSLTSDLDAVTRG